MNDIELIKLMLENDFSNKQINHLKMLSEKYSTSLYDTVSELARRFLRSLFIHIFTFLLIFHTYIRFSKEYGYSFQGLLFHTGILFLTYIIYNLFAPLHQGYKAKKVIRKIKCNSK